MNIHILFGERLRSALDRSGMSINEAARRSGYHTTTLARLMAGKSNASIQLVWDMATTLHVEPLWLLGGPSRPGSHESRETLAFNWIEARKSRSILWTPKKLLEACALVDQGLSWRKVAHRLDIVSFRSVQQAVAKFREYEEKTCKQ